MERWTIHQPSAGRYSLRINHGGERFWCMFDYRLQPLPEFDGVKVQLTTDADTESAEWFPHLRLGILRGMDVMRERNCVWVGIRVEVCKIHTHITDTTARSCEYYGFSFAITELPRLGTPLLD